MPIVGNTVNTRDKRCERTRAAVEKSLFYYYMEHPFFEQPPVIYLCRMANISTPTFYRHFKGVYEVVEASHEAMRNELVGLVKSSNSLKTSLFKLFHFIRKHEIYYRMNIYQMSFRPFKQIVEVFEPKITASLSKDIQQKSYYEIESYLVVELSWWIVKDGFDDSLVEMHIKAILDFMERKTKEYRS